MAAFTGPVGRVAEADLPAQLVRYLEAVLRWEALRRPPGDDGGPDRAARRPGPAGPSGADALEEPSGGR